ncbi:hypothetical protein COV93_03545 [Candidatus Woesearchaeota archaeon CG11_big_fil_rev_8_21_14_0_20_43_8]|nr:MAG: hypothetical protein COV93_03545 [Candidatus Woesearchaeota archaeon CG11_big_fil_rev_8_21_14_0_20_43_8]PIO06964.1 MAG: hypothetical protein COT47_02055 [Candidatus Woesearchaeota archaeon CG08_land_8_20_14_0_20_43_7]
MATFLDITLLEQFSSVFAVIFVFAVVFMIFQGTKIFGTNKNLHAIVAFCIAIFVLLSATVRNMIMLMSPWFVILFLVTLFILVGVKMLGISDNDISSAIKSDEHKYVIYFIVAFAIIILMYALSQSFGQNVGPYLGGDSSSGTSGSGSNTTSVSGDGTTNTGNFNQNLAATIFHPKVLGMIFLLLIASFTMRLLAKKD